MSGAGRAIVGAILGGVLGIAIPVALAMVYLWLGGDPQGAGVFSFFPLLLIPLGLFVGWHMGSVWSPDATLGQNVARGLRKVAVGLWKVFRPRWI